ncbi:MAG: hypothetical protein AAFR72_09180 [Pseudomonadota bacterium]
MLGSMLEKALASVLTIEKRGLATLIAGLAGALMLLGGAVYSHTALAQAVAPQPPLSLKSDFLGYAISLSPRVGYTDNINLVSGRQFDADGNVTSEDNPFREGQTILSNLVTANAIISLPRFTALFSGDLDFSYLVENGDLVLNQSVGAAGTATIVDNYLYFDVAGGSSRQLVGDNAAFSANASAARGDRATVNSYALSPYLFHQLPNQSTVEARYRYSQVFINDSGINPAVIPTGAALPGDGLEFLNDATSHEALLQYESGNLFDRFRFIATAYGNLTEESGSDIIPEFSFDQGTVSLQAQYGLTSKFALSGAIGYDEIDTNDSTNFFDDEDLSGVFWRAGFIARPGRRSRLQLEYGRRFGDDFIQADARYEISRRFVFTAGATRTFQTRALANSQRITQIGRSTLDFADQLREGGEGSPRNIIQQATQLTSQGGGINAQVSGIGPTNTAFASLTGTFDKSIVSFNTIYQASDFGFRQFENITSTLNYTRNLSRRVSIYGNALYRYSDTGFDVNDCVVNPQNFGIPTFLINSDPLTECTALANQEGVSHTLSGTMGMNYAFSSRLRAFGQYSRTDRFSPIEQLEFNENAVTAGIIVDF